MCPFLPLTCFSACKSSIDPTSVSSSSTVPGTSVASFGSSIPRYPIVVAEYVRSSSRKERRQRKIRIETLQLRITLEFGGYFLLNLWRDHEHKRH